MQKLNKAEEFLHSEIVNSTRDGFIKTILEAQDSQYNYLVEFVRKLKILQLPVPDYLCNLSLAEMEVAKKAQLSQKRWVLHTSIEKLTESQEKELALIHFRWHVQYL